MVKSYHRTVHSPSPSAGVTIRHFATTTGQGNPGFSLLNADSRAGRDMRVFGRFNSGEQDGHGKSRMVVSLGDEPRFYPAWRPVILTKNDEVGCTCPVGQDLPYLNPVFTPLGGQSF